MFRCFQRTVYDDNNLNVPKEDKGGRVSDGADVERLDFLPAPRLTDTRSPRGSPHILLPWGVDKYLSHVDHVCHVCHVTKLD